MNPENFGTLFKYVESSPELETNRNIELHKTFGEGNPIHLYLLDRNSELYLATSRKLSSDELQAMKFVLELKAFGHDFKNEDIEKLNTAGKNKVGFFKTHEDQLGDFEYHMEQFYWDTWLDLKFVEENYTKFRNGDFDR